MVTCLAPGRRFGRPNRAFSPFSLPRRPCPFGHNGPHNPDAMLKHMAAARFGPDLLSSLLASAEVPLAVLVEDAVS